MMSRTISQAAGQGKTEADSALAAASDLGISGSILYYDMEAYSTSDPQCSAAVQAFVNSWDQELHANGSMAGVYGSPSNAAADWAPGTISNPPDAIWFAVWDGVDSVWDPDAISNNLWPSSQRIHQYCSDPGTVCSDGDTFGGVTFSIDGDVLDAPVLPSAITATGFTLSLQTQSLTVASGGSVSDTMTVTAVGGYTGTLQFLCNGLPQGATCTFDPTSINFTAATTTAATTVTIQTTKTAANLRPMQAPSHGPVDPAAVFMMSGCLMMALGGTSRKLDARAGRLLVLLLLGGVNMLAACGGGNSHTSSAPPPPVTPAGTSTISVTAYGSGGLYQKASLFLTVQ